IQVPREVATEVSEPSAPAQAGAKRAPGKAAAGIPASYIAQAQQRIEVCRKLAQAAEAGALRELRASLRDRFGPPPPAVELALQAADLKLTAAERGITMIETQEGKLMLTRRNDYIMVGGKFPRLKKSAPA